MPDSKTFYATVDSNDGIHLVASGLEVSQAIIQDVLKIELLDDER